MKVSRISSVAVLSLVLLTAYAYFVPISGYNQDSRLDLVRAIVERQTLTIDAYKDNTGDKAVFGGHYYSDKAPGQALLAIAPVAVVTAVLGPPERALDPNRVQLLRYIATVFASAVPTIVGALALAWTARQPGSSRGGALFAAIVYGLGTPAWVYATMLMGNNLAAAALMVALASSLAFQRSSTGRSQTTAGILVGLAAGVAAISEYQAGPAALIVCVFALSRAGRNLGRMARLGATIGLGALGPTCVLGAYNVAAFGSVLAVGYQGVQGWDAFHSGVIGVTSPDLSTLREITVGQFRGLLPVAPVLLTAPVGLWLWWTSGSRALAATAAAVVVYYFLVTASFAYWDGGWAYGPRYVGAALPFACLGLAPAWTAARRFGRAALLVAAGWGILLAAAAASTSPTPDNAITDPVIRIFLPALFGRVGADVLSQAPASPGLWFGLRGPVSLLPLVLVWLAVWLCLRGVEWTAQPRVQRSRAPSTS